jgi:hypothetical protein
MNSRREKQLLMHQYQDETGIQEIDPHAVAAWAIDRGYLKPPPPIDPYDRLAKELSKAWRAEFRRDKRTNRQYRANQCFQAVRGGKQVNLWFDIDLPSATFPKMAYSSQLRRRQMLGDALQLSLDEDHWNSDHPDGEQLQSVLDFALDVQWLKNSDENEEAS